MSEAQNIARRYIWATDLDSFVDVQDSNRRVSEDVIKRRLVKSMDLNDAAALMNTMKLSGVPSGTLKRAKQSPIQIFRAVYEGLRDLLPYKILFDNATDRIFKVSEHGEYSLIGDLDRDSFTSLIIGDKVCREYLHAELHTGEHSEFLKARISMKALCASMFDEFVTDPAVRINESPKLLSWSPEIPAFKVMNVDTIKAGPHPNWDSFCARIDYPATFKAFMWSIFVPSNYGRQALWIQGEGSDGKSSVLNALAEYMGHSHTLSIGRGSYDSDFFFGEAFGKRLAIYADCKNLQVLRKERIKSLLGKDTVSINKKYQAPFSSQLYSKLLVASNFFPQINYNDDSERTRLLLIKVRKFPDEFGDPDFQENLVRELSAFLHHCQAFYETECPNGMALKVPQKMAGDIKTVCSATDSDLLEQFIEERLIFGAQFYARKTEVRLALREYFARNSALQESGFSEQDLARLLIKRGIGMDTIKGKGRCYIGVRIEGSHNSLKEGME